MSISYTIKSFLLTKVTLHAELQCPTLLQHSENLLTNCTLQLLRTKESSNCNCKPTPPTRTTQIVGIAQTARTNIEASLTIGVAYNIHTLATAATAVAASFAKRKAVAHGSTPRRSKMRNGLGSGPRT